MPYRRWLETLHRYTALPAIHEGERTVTFAQLAESVSQTPEARSPVVARSGSVDFFVQILRAWRDGQPVIPVERDAPEPKIGSIPPKGTCLVKYTPGASGVPRGIFFNGVQVEADGDRLVSAMGLTPQTPNLAVISLAHSYGFSNVVLPLLLHGVPAHLAPVPFPRAIQDILQKHGPLVVPAVPSIWRAWHRAGILKPGQISLAISAGAPLSLELEREVYDSAGLKIHNFYGASECGGISMDMTAVPRKSAKELGAPLPGVEVSIGHGGRLLVRSNSVAIGYEVTRAEDLLGEGCYLTRDLGTIDPEGGIHLTGTLGGAINVAGRKVSPAKIEAALLATGLVQRVQVHGVRSNDPERFEEIAADVVMKDGVKLEELKTAATQLLQLWEVPRQWRW